MKRMHLRIPSLLLALLLLLWTLPASAQTPEELKAALMAEFSALTQQEKIAELEKQILDLKLQQAQLTGDEATIADVTAQLAVNQQTLAALALRKEDTALAIINAAKQQQTEREAELASLTDALAQTQSQIDTVNAILASLTSEMAQYQTYADAALFRGQPVTTAMGFVSMVEVTVALDENGVITAVRADCSGETPGFGTRCSEEAFLSQFVGQKGPFRAAYNHERIVAESAREYTDIDVVAGASVTSRAVIDAVNSLFPAAEISSELTASAKGLLSDVTVYVTMDTDGTIWAISVDCSGETRAIAAPCTEEPFLSQFIGRKGPFHDVDIVTGATVTSNAVINAVNSLFLAEHSASAKGLLSDVTVYVTMDTDGTIWAISVDCSGETRAIAAPCTEEPFLSQFIGRKGPFHDVDIVTGATVTSNAVINAVNSLFD